jgi:hypothetical protein
MENLKNRHLVLAATFQALFEVVLEPVEVVPELEVLHAHQVELVLQVVDDPGVKGVFTALKKTFKCMYLHTLISTYLPLKVHTFDVCRYSL